MAWHSSVSKLVDEIHQKVHRAAELSPWNDIRTHQDLSNPDLRTELIDDTRDLLHLLQGPTQTLSQYAFRIHDVSVLSVLLEFHIPEAIPKDRGISFAELGESVGMSEEKLQQIIRYAFTNSIFREHPLNHVSHTPLSSHLASEKGLQAALGMWCDEVVRASGFLVDHLRLFSESQSPIDTGFNLAFGTGKTYFEYITQATEWKRLARFQTAQAALNGTEAPLSVTIKAYPWKSLSTNALVVDVGGNNGFTARALARTYRKLRFVVQDFGPIVEAGAKELKINEDHDVCARVSFMAHDFFKLQPLEADVYMIRQVLHDWPDESCRQILRSLIPALKPGNRVLVVDSIMLSTETLKSKTVERSLRQRDLLLLTVNNAKERCEADFIALLGSADSRLIFRRSWGAEKEQAERVFELAFEPAQ